MLESDLLEAIIALPAEMFYNTGISTYIWVVSNRKPAHRKGKLQLINAVSFWEYMRRSLGEKRKEMTSEHIAEVTRLFGMFVESSQEGTPISRVFDNRDFGYRTITVEQPLQRDGNRVFIAKGRFAGKPQPDIELRDTENVPLEEDIDEYFEREVKPHLPDAWIDSERTKVGYVIPFNKHFWVFKSPRELSAIDQDLDQKGRRISELLAGVAGEREAIISRTLAKYADLGVSTKDSAISRTVAKYSDRDVTTKDSGVNWLGRVPIHWAVVQSRRYFRERNTRALDGDVQLTASQRHGIIPQDEYMKIENQKVVQVTKNREILKHVEPNDFIISMRSFQGGIEWCGLSGCVSSAYTILIPSVEVEPRFFSHLFKSQIYIQALQATSNLVRDGQALRFENFAQVRLPLFSVDEQIAIAEFLDAEVALIDARIANLRSAIEVLQQRRAALFKSQVYVQFLQRTSPAKRGQAPNFAANEEHALAALGREIATIDALDAELRSASELMEERHTSLVSSAVTGKLDLRVSPAKQLEEVAAA